MVVLLDSGLLWTLVHPNGGQEQKDLRTKLAERLTQGDSLAISAISDYEARRELIRKNATGQIARLDKLIKDCTYLELDQTTLHRAAALWAQLRAGGKPGASADSIDADVILAAHALGIVDHLVATTNVKHFQNVCNACDWHTL